MYPDDLEHCGVRGANILRTLSTVEDPCVTFDSPNTSLVPRYSWRTGSRTPTLSPQTPKCVGARVPSVKWHRTMHAVSLPHPRIPSLGLRIWFNCHWLNWWMQNPGLQRADCLFVGKGLHVSGPAQFRPTLLKGHYRPVHLCLFDNREIKHRVNPSLRLH